MYMRETSWPHALRWQAAHRVQTSRVNLSMQKTAQCTWRTPAPSGSASPAASGSPVAPVPPDCPAARTATSTSSAGSLVASACRLSARPRRRRLTRLQVCSSSWHRTKPPPCMQRGSRKLGCSVDMDRKADGRLLKLTVATDPGSWTACWEQWHYRRSDRLEAGRHLLRSKQLLQPGQVCSNFCCHCAAGLKLLPRSLPGAVCRADQGLHHHRVGISIVLAGNSGDEEHSTLVAGGGSGWGRNHLSEPHVPTYGCVEGLNQGQIPPMWRQSCHQV